MKRGTDFIAAAYCVETGYGDRYEVFCTKCLLPFGTMHLVDITRAIIATLGRGGVLCPSCRKTTCDSCGKIEVVRPRGKKGSHAILQLCYECEEQLEALGMVAEETTENEFPFSVPL